MNINQIIETTLGEVTEHIWPAVCPDAEAPDKYIVYNSDIETPGLYAEDRDENWVCHMQIHLYTRENYLKDKKIIKEKLRVAGFILEDIETLYEKNSRYHHICFECSIEEGE